jgi:hypothetical protein
MLAKSRCTACFCSQSLLTIIYKNKCYKMPFCRQIE